MSVGAAGFRADAYDSQSGVHEPPERRSRRVAGTVAAREPWDRVGKGGVVNSKWTKPELVVLQRARAEERVLGTCKILNAIGPADTQDSCEITGCPQCETLSVS